VIYRHPDARQAARACGTHILAKLEEGIAKNGRAWLAISGGSSPRPMFEMFAQTRFTWEAVQLFFVDERVVPPTDPQSNFKFANETWLAPGNFPKYNIHRIAAELDPAAAARNYAEEIRSILGDTSQFDVIHQGMGPDGHTASLFPGEPLIDDRNGLAAAVWVEKFKQWRITLLPAVLLAARHTAMLVTGADKAGALKAVLDGPFEPQKHPAQIIAKNRTDAAWFVDDAAARMLAPQS
jgi:6-phosphogluconolactonase